MQRRVAVALEGLRVPDFAPSQLARLVLLGLDDFVGRDVERNADVHRFVLFKARALT